MYETGHHSPPQPAEQPGEELLPEPGQEEAQVRHLHRLHTVMVKGGAPPTLTVEEGAVQQQYLLPVPNTLSLLLSSSHPHCFPWT